MEVELNPRRLVMDLTLTIPDELATRVRAVEDRLPEILELGLRELLLSSISFVWPKHGPSSVRHGAERA